jgi:hypothetical protein
MEAKSFNPAHSAANRFCYWQLSASARPISGLCPIQDHKKDAETCYD